MRGVQYPIRISDLDAKQAPESGDQLPIFSTSDGDTMKVSVKALAAFIVAQVGVADTKQTQYFNPSASPFTIQVVTPTAPNTSVWLILAPTGTLAVGIITLPPVVSTNDRMEVLITCTQIVTTLTVAAGSAGTTVTGAPVTLAANSVTRMRYDAGTNTWYKA